MHAQIRNVISRLQWFSRQEVLVELSASEGSALGQLVCRLYYDTRVMDVVDRQARFGYPHNGGQHTFTYRGSPSDAVAMLELFQEALREFKLTPEQSQVVNEFSYISQEILAGRRQR